MEPWTGTGSMDTGAKTGACEDVSSGAKVDKGARGAACGNLTDCVGVIVLGGVEKLEDPTDDDLEVEGIGGK
jgi:hypothetical protein